MERRTFFSYCLGLVASGVAYGYDLQSPRVRIVEVLCFFSWSSPASLSLDQELFTHASSLPSCLRLTYVPFGYSSQERFWISLYYALESCVDRERLMVLRHLLFHDIQIHRLPLRSNEEALEWASHHGIDTHALDRALRSFETQTKVTKAEQWAQLYRVDRVPLLVHREKKTLFFYPSSQQTPVELLTQWCGSSHLSTPKSFVPNL